MNGAVTMLLLAALAAAPAAAGDPPAADPAAEATLAFGLDLYPRVKAAGKNVFFSPYSVAAALAMVRVGARGETAREMDAVLHFGEGVPAAAHGALKQALVPRTVRDGRGREAAEVPAYELSTANALWVQEALAIEADFVKTLAGEFGAPLERIDFRETAAARARINEWVAQRTRERIQNIVPEGLPAPDTLLALANAIYFKAAWTKPFQENLTAEAPFHVAADREVEAKFMHRVETLGYLEDDEVQVAELPYRGNDTSMVVVLPRARDGLAAVEKGLAVAKVKGWLDGLRPTAVKLTLPRFEFTCPMDITGALNALGMKQAFARNADLSGITAAGPLFLSTVLHKAFIAVDEAGTEAAAATVVISRGGGRPRDPREFVADHPFLFLIRHRQTGAVLFLGALETPAG
ncbi:MAG: serpin family protein [Planctomycetes bacterium]|nr:serpin family protein [Planctomycetota bacterium]